MNTLNTFEIRVERKYDEQWRVVVELNAAGENFSEQKDGFFQLDREKLLAATPSEYGELLGKALFQADVRDAFVRALAKSNGRLHVLLCIEDAELRMLRWERLWAPFDGCWNFLSLDQRVPFSLHLPSNSSQHFPPIGRLDLRALVLVASPRDPKHAYPLLTPFDVDATVRRLRTALGDIDLDVLAHVEGAKGPPTLNALCNRLNAKRYTLLHIVCHGQQQTDDTYLFMDKSEEEITEKDSSPMDRVSGEALLKRLGTLGGKLPYFAFLSICESAAVDAPANLGGLAQRLVQRPEVGMPAVLAMTDRVTVVTAQMLADGFYPQLRCHGMPDLALVEAFAGLAQRHDVNVPALFSRLGGRPLYSLQARPLKNEEIEYGLTCLKKLLVDWAPILLPVLERHALKLPGAVTTKPVNPHSEAGKEWDAALAGVNHLCYEVLELTFFDLAARGDEPPKYNALCPFRGLDPFRVEDYQFFFGREELIVLLAERLAEANFLAVVGPSGSGKSSVVLAGLVPLLQGKEQGFSLAYLTPGSNPLDSLNAVLQVPEPPSLLVVDQFEELFTLCTEDAKRRAFLTYLLQLPERMRVVLTLRADFWGECAPYRELKDVMQVRQELIAPMKAPELRRAMELQAAKVGLRFEADLSNTILDVVKDEPGAMPLLQHALRVLWGRRRGRWLTTKKVGTEDKVEYEDPNWVREAIGKTAEDVYGKLSSDEKQFVRFIFVRLTRLDRETLRTEERRDTRQRVELSQLNPAGSELKDAKALVKRLADARLLVTTVHPATGCVEVEVAHEALIRYWKRLHQWLDENRADLRLRERLSDEAGEWKKAEKSDALLELRGSRLDDAERLAGDATLGLTSQEKEYVEACLKQRRRERDEAKRQQAEKLAAAEQLAAEAEARRQAEEIARQEAERRAEQEAIGRKQLRRRMFLILALLLAVTVTAVLAWQSRQEATQNLYQARLVDVQQSLNLGDMSGLRKKEPEFRDMLDPEDQKTFAWRYLRKLCRDQPRTWNDGFGEVWTVGHSADGKTLVWATEEPRNSCAIRSCLVTGPQAQPSEPVVIACNARIYSLMLSPDCQCIASGHPAGNIILWNASTGKPMPGWPEPPLLNDSSYPKPFIRALAFSSDGRTLAAGSSDGNVSLWDTDSGKKITFFIENKLGTVYSLAFSHDGSVLATGSMVRAQNGSFRIGGPRSGEVRLWNIASGEEFGSGTKRTHNGKVYALAFSASAGNVLASADDCGTVSVWGRSDWTELGTWRGHQRGVKSLAFSPQDDNTLASGSEDKTIKLWDLASQSEKVTFKGHDDALRSLMFSRDGKTLASGSRDKTVKLWDASRRDSYGGHTSGAMSLAFSPDSTRLALGSKDSENKPQVLLIDLANGQVRKIGQHDNEVACVAFAPGGRRVASSSFDNTVALWSTEQDPILSPPTPWSPNIDYILYLSFDDKPNRLLAGGQKNVKLLDLATGKELSPFNPQRLDAVSWALSQDGKLLGLGHEDGFVTLWDVETGARQSKLTPTTAEVIALAFRPGELKGGQTLAAGLRDGTIILCNWNDKTPVYTHLEGHTARIASLEFSPDGRTLASGSADGSVKLWEVKSKSLQLTLKSDNTQGITCVRFSPNGEWLASRSQEGVVTLWPAEKEVKGPAEASYQLLMIASSAVVLGTVLAIWIFRKWIRTRRTNPAQKQQT